MKQKLRFLGIALITAIAGNSIAQTVFINEPFNGTVVPAGWTQNTLATDGGWKVGTAASNSSQFWPIPTHDGNMAATNDDQCNCNKSNDQLVTPTIDLTVSTNALLSFDYYFNGATYQGNTETFKLEISTDDGVSWSLVQNIPSVSDWTTLLVNLTDYVGDEIKLAFTYNDGTGWLFGSAIDNVIVTEVVDYDLATLSLNIEEYVLNNTPKTLTGVIQNFGSETVTSMRLNYSINGGATVSEDLLGLNIPLTGTYNFSHSNDWTPNTVGSHTIKFWADNINGNVDEVNSNDTITVSTFVADELAQRKVLFEQFTSNTCVPCASSDPTIMSFLSTNGANTASGKMVAIKYHMNYPAPGTDQAYTAESGTRHTYYGVTGVPHASIGNVYSGHPLSLTQLTVDNEYNRPTIFNLSATAEYQNNNVSVNVNVNSLVDFSTANTRLHVVLIEDEITASDFSPAPTTSQTMFKYVMRKMLPNATGTLIPTMTSGGNEAFNFNHTINNMIVGNMENLSVVVFLQNSTTKEVYQVFSAPLSGNVGLNTLSNDLTMNLYPNPATESATLTFTADSDNATVDVINSLGQKVYSVNLGNVNGKQTVTIPTAELSEGLYFVNVQATNGSTATARLSVIK